MSDRLTLLRPDDWHIHLRDGAALPHTVADAARQFARAIIMPNLVPPVRNANEAQGYRQRILAARPDGSQFEPLMVLYLTDATQPEEIRTAKASGYVFAAKLYPAGATTNSASGVTRIDNIFPVLETMAEVGLPLLVHGEVTRAEIDIFDREKYFIDEQLSRVTERFPTLKVVFEHITTRDAVQFVQAAGDNVGATITAHHLLYNRNHMLVGGIRPHFFCLPILKRNTHQEALLDAATSGNPEVLPRNRLGTARPAREGKRLRLCRLLHRLRGHRTLRRSVRAAWCTGSPGGIRQPLRRGLLRPAPQHRHHHAGARVLERPRQPALRRTRRRPLRAGETLQWRLEPRS